MSCFCELFENETLWLIILSLLILSLICGNNYGNNGCGCR